MSLSSIIQTLKQFPEKTGTKPLRRLLFAKKIIGYRSNTFHRTAIVGGSSSANVAAVFSHLASNIKYHVFVYQPSPNKPVDQWYRFNNAPLEVAFLLQQLQTLIVTLKLEDKTAHYSQSDITYLLSLQCCKHLHADTYVFAAEEQSHLHALKCTLPQSIILTELFDQHVRPQSQIARDWHQTLASKGHLIVSSTIETSIDKTLVKQNNHQLKVLSRTKTPTQPIINHLHADAYQYAIRNINSLFEKKWRRKTKHVQDIPFLIGNYTWATRNSVSCYIKDESDIFSLFQLINNDLYLRTFEKVHFVHQDQHDDTIVSCLRACIEKSKFAYMSTLTKSSSKHISTVTSPHREVTINIT
jgi:hypothetical protein